MSSSRPLDVSASYNPAERAVFLNVSNRSRGTDIRTRIECVTGALEAPIGVWEMNHADLKATHTFGDDERVRRSRER